MLMGMNEDSYVGKIQRKIRVFFLGKGNFQKKEKKTYQKRWMEGWRKGFVN